MTIIQLPDSSNCHWWHLSVKRWRHQKVLPVRGRTGSPVPLSLLPFWLGCPLPGEQDLVGGECGGNAALDQEGLGTWGPCRDRPCPLGGTSLCIQGLLEFKHTLLLSSWVESMPYKCLLASGLADLTSVLEGNVLPQCSFLRIQDAAQNGPCGELCLLFGFGCQFGDVVWTMPRRAEGAMEPEYQHSRL